ncbi:hypothetical protein JCM19238_679 [Vibrio ponticus]|nr:hypothetical protein JCM19238_679 [Vibrio ponticus]
MQGALRTLALAKLSFFFLLFKQNLVQNYQNSNLSKQQLFK